MASTSSDQITSFVSVARLLLPSSGLSPGRAELVEQDLATLDAEARRTTPREDVCQALVLAVVDELTAASTTPQPGA